MRVGVAGPRCYFLMMRAGITFTAIMALATPALGASLPAFADLPAKPVYSGPLAQPDTRSAAVKAYRSRIIDGARQRPNFAGHYRLVEWGCGTSCVMGAVADAKTGKVIPLPFSVCCYDGPMGEPGWSAIKFKLTSRLILFRGQRDEEGANGTHYYEFTGDAFRYLETDPTLRE